jgi:hypothetical protein
MAPASVRQGWRRQPDLIVSVQSLGLHTLLGLRDSLFSYDIKRNAAGAVVRATFFGRGWGRRYVSRGRVRNGARRARDTRRS